MFFKMWRCTAQWKWKKKQFEQRIFGTGRRIIKSNVKFKHYLFSFCFTTKFFSLTSYQPIHYKYCNKTIHCAWCFLFICYSILSSPSQPIFVRIDTMVLKYRNMLWHNALDLWKKNLDFSFFRSFAIPYTCYTFLRLSSKVLGKWIDQEVIYH